jgi:hypothetical protein
LNAIYTPKVFQPQEDDIAYARKLYGPPIVTTPPVPPGDYPAVVPCSIEFTIGGAKYRAQGNAKRVA